MSKIFLLKIISNSKTKNLIIIIDKTGNDRRTSQHLDF